MVQCEGGGKIKSSVSLKALSKRSGIRQDSKEQGVSRHGLVLTSMSQVLKWESIMISNPKISKLNPFLMLSKVEADA